jgi:hypothetical protein
MQNPTAVHMAVFRTQFLLCPPCRPCHRATQKEDQPLDNTARPPPDQGWPAAGLSGQTGASCPPTDLVRRSRHVGAAVPHMYSALAGRQHVHVQGRLPGEC